VVGDETDVCGGCDRQPRIQTCREHRDEKLFAHCPAASESLKYFSRASGKFRTGQISARQLFRLKARSGSQVACSEVYFAQMGVG
jgi:hypothetical protein